MSPNDLHYLGAIKRRLKEFKDALADTAQFSLGGQAFVDEIDWLDCFIDQHERANARRNGESPRTIPEEPNGKP